MKQPFNLTKGSRSHSMSRKIGFYLTALFTLMTPLGLAEEGMDWGNTTGNVALTSNYVFRGISQTQSRPTLQGSLDYSHPAGFYLGFWGSGLDYGVSQPRHEFDFYGGYTHSINKSLSLSVGALNYAFVGQGTRNTLEFPLKLQWEDFRIGYAFAPLWLGTGGFGGYASAGWTRPYAWHLSPAVSLGVSHFSGKAPYSAYADFRAGISRPFLGITADVSLTAVTRHQFSENDKNKLIFTLSKSL